MSPTIFVSILVYSPILSVAQEVFDGLLFLSQLLYFHVFARVYDVTAKSHLCSHAW